MLAYAILIIGALTSFICYTRLSTLLPMREEAAVTHTDARVTDVRTPMIQKGRTASDVVSEVSFTFHAVGQEIHGYYRTMRGEAAPAKHGTEPVVYLTRDPHVFLRAEAYKQLPQQLNILRVMMLVFALAAIILPFVVLAKR